MQTQTRDFFLIFNIFLFTNKRTFFSSSCQFSKDFPPRFSYLHELFSTCITDIKYEERETLGFAYCQSFFHDYAEEGFDTTIIYILIYDIVFYLHERWRWTWFKIFKLLKVPLLMTIFWTGGNGKIWKLCWIIAWGFARVRKFLNEDLEHEVNVSFF